MPTAPTSKPRFVGERELIKLSEIAKIKAGNVAPKKDAFTEDGIPFVRAGSLTNLLAGGSLADLEKIDDGAAQKLRLTLFPAGTVVFAKSGMSCMTGNVYVLPKPCYVVSHLACVIPNGNYASYLKHYFRFNHPNRLIENPSFPSIKLSKIQGIELRLPSSKEGVRQVQALERIESQIEQAKALLTRLDSLAKSRFVEMFGDLEHGYKCSSCKLESIAEVGSSRRVFKNELLSEGVPFYRGTEVAELSAGGSIKPSLFISKEHYERLIGSTGKPEIGDLLLPSICPGGQIWCVNTNAPFYFKDGRVLWIRPDRDAVDGVYLRHALSTMFQMSFSNIASGTTFAELKIFLLKELNVPLPELKDQKEFVSFASQVDKSRFVRDHEMNFRCERFTLSWSTIA